MPPPSSLIIRAGPKAMATIRQHGLQPAQVAVVPGAAGGPKALGIIGLDHALFGDWLPRAPRVRDLIGVSIGAWRFAGVCRGDIAAALKDFGDIYVGQTYPPRPSAQMVSESAHTNTRQLLGGREADVLSHPHYRLHVIGPRPRVAMTCSRSIEPAHAGRVRRGGSGQRLRPPPPAPPGRAHVVSRSTRHARLHG